ncbi:manganese efflux pump MntP [Sporosarcina sp. G11-34]|uniref:manganese efflux pump MntP n=1 Tax=Sporosarcina sp. G11-34 TaxID=2849605 RepID=UPI0022A9B229|nr:manganese efflux pump [Sporosarcina sp. G11-34]MCZ2257858.1 manganese efflux pump [Sporosarcina sp. G11-34]
MQWLTILLIGVAANIDNLGISVSFGLKSNRIPLLSNLLISFISMLCAFFSITAGSYLSDYFSQSIANFIGGSLIIGLGVWCIATSPVFTKGDLPQKQTSCRPISPGIEKIKSITWKESIFLGFILALNCLTIGFGAGVTGVPPLFTSLSIGIFSVISISLGIIVGNKIGHTVLGRYLNTIAGLLLIIIGIYEMMN